MHCFLFRGLKESERYVKHEIIKRLEEELKYPPGRSRGIYALYVKKFCDFIFF
jgi:hypothetical protein